MNKHTTITAESYSDRFGPTHAPELSLPERWQAKRDGPEWRNMARTIAAEVNPAHGSTNTNAHLHAAAVSLSLASDEAEVEGYKAELDYLFQLSDAEEAFGERAARYSMRSGLDPAYCPELEAERPVRCAWGMS